MLDKDSKFRVVVSSHNNEKMRKQMHESCYTIVSSNNQANTQTSEIETVTGNPGSKLSLNKQSSPIKVIRCGDLDNTLSPPPEAASPHELSKE